LLCQQRLIACHGMLKALGSSTVGAFQNARASRLVTTARHAGNVCLLDDWS
jgi:hypothetical protein